MSHVVHLFCLFPRAAIVAAVVLFGSCRSELGPPLESEPPASGESAGHVREDTPAEIPLDALDLVDPRLHVSPTDHSWQSEHLSDAIGRQLKALGERLERHQTGAAVEWSDGLDESFQCGRLRPADLSVAYEDTSLVIRRPSGSNAPKAEDAPAPLRGSAGLSQAASELLEPFPEHAEIVAHFKISHVEVREDTATTKVHVQLHGDGDGSSEQQNAVWQCRWRCTTGATPRLASLVVEDFEEIVARTPAGGLFVDCTEAALGENPSYREQLCRGVDHWTDRIERRHLEGPSGWHGLAIGDVNGDGLEDVYLCQDGGLPNRLYVGTADGKLRDVSAEAGVDWLDSTQAALLVDLDNDGDQDLVVGAALGLIFMSNDGRGLFQVAATQLTPDALPYSLSAADFDDDGDLDVYACGYSPRAVARSRGLLGRPLPYHDANNGGRNSLLRNDGSFHFRNVTRQVGLDENNRRFSLAAAWEDYDNDGDLDLYVANDFGRNNLYRNEGGRFHDVAAAAGVEDISAGMSVSWGDYNRDGQMDLYVSNMWSSAGGRIAYQRRFLSAADEQTRSGFQRHARGNSLFVNMGDGTFRDQSELAGVTLGRWAWGSVFWDLNNDGREDLYVANGYLTQEDTDDL